MNKRLHGIIQQNYPSLKRYFFPRRATLNCVVKDCNMLHISLCMLYREHISSRLSNNSEANALELISKKYFLVTDSI